MDIRRASGILGAAFISISLVACGGGPDIEKAKADFANPSGKTADKNGVIAAQGKQDSSQGAMTLGSGGVPGGSVFGGLTATGKQGFGKASVTRLLVPQAERLRALVQHDQMRPFALNIAQSDDCGAAEAQAALGSDVSVNSSGEASGSASFTIDYSSCAGSGLTGSADYDLEYEVTQTSIKMTINVSMNALCTTEDGNCINGSMAMELSGATGAGATGNSFQTIVAWDLTTTTGGKDIKAKGGIKMGFDDTSANIQILVYVNTPDGEEWSYVLETTQNFDGSGSLKIRGSDGSLDCSWTADGAGQCSGDTGSLSWTAEESTAVENEDWFAEG